MDEAVADATVLSYLAKLDRLDSLGSYHEAILVPEPVHQEVVIDGRAMGHPDALIVERALDHALLRLAKVPDPQPGAVDRLGLEAGDAAVLAVALKRQVPTVLTDDGPLRTYARTLGLTPRGTLAFLIGDLRDSRLSFDGYLTALEELNQAGFRMSADVYARAVRRGREIAQED